MRRRHEKARVDTSEQRESINQARRAAFKGKSLAGQSVQRHLAARSLNPIHVSVSMCMLLFIDPCTPERILYSVQRVWGEFLRDFRSRLDA